MNKQNPISLERLQQKLTSRRNLIRCVAATTLGTGLLRPKPTYADHKDDNGGKFQGPLLKPIPGGVVPFQPFGVPVHHNPLNPAVALADIGDPSMITDFDGFAALTHIRGGGTGTSSGATTPLAYQADMGFGRGKFIGIDGRPHTGTFAFV